MSEKPDVADGQKELLDLLLGSSESARIAATVDMLFQLESYLRVISLSLAGVGVKHELTGDLSRDLYGTRVVADEAAAWLLKLQTALHKHVSPSEPAASQDPSESEPEKRVVH